MSDRSEVSAMLDILSLQQYSKVFAAKGLTTIHQLTSAIDDPKCEAAFWTKLIAKPHDRNIVIGYLSIRRKQDPSEAARSEQRMQAFRTVKDALMELQNLQLKKAELERGSTVLNRQESVRQGIENILDKIDETKQKLEIAQRSVQNDSRTLPSKRPKSANLRHIFEAPKSPRVDNESPLRKAPAPQRSVGGASESSAPMSGVETDVGTCFAGVCFETRHEERPLTNSVRERRLDVGHGWNRNAPVPRMRQWASAREASTRFVERPGTSTNRGRSEQQGTQFHELAIRGVKATSVALGVQLDGDHFAQMCCGATSQAHSH